MGRWLAALEDARARTLRAVEGMPSHAVDRVSGRSPNTVGTLLYHVAAIEADWLFADILGPESGVPWPEGLFPYDVREEGGLLTPVLGLSLAEHLDRLSAVRAMLMERLRGFSAGELRRMREREDYDVSAEWVLHHLLQHEAEHRSQLSAAVTP